MPSVLQSPALLDAIRPWVRLPEDSSSDVLDSTVRQLVERYDILNTVTLLRRKEVKNVALQFPDGLLEDSFMVCAALERGLNIADSQCEHESSANVFVLADTSYGECCVDEVAAAHLGADVVVHYGNTCLSPTRNLPVVYVLPQASESIHAGPRTIAQGPVLVLDRLVAQVRSVSERHDGPCRVVVLYDIELWRQVSELVPGSSGTLRGLEAAVLREAAHENLRSVVVASPRVQIDQIVEPTRELSGTRTTCACSSEAVRQTTSRADPAKSDDDEEDTSQRCDKSALNGVSESGLVRRTRIGPLEYEEHSEGCGGDAETNLPDVFLWISEGTSDDPSIQLRNAGMLISSSSAGTQLHVWPVRSDRDAESISMSRLLAKRYHMIEKARSAETFGIIAGTLGVSGNLAAIERCKRAIEAVGKRWYMLMIGKPSPTKVDNFPELDVFVLVACPQTSLLDSREYMRPVITPLELEASLTEGEWATGRYTLDFADLLDRDVVQLAKDEASNASTEPSESTTLANRGEWGVAVSAPGSAADFLKRRQWQGLESQRDANGETVDALDTRVRQGRTGVASSYENENR